MIFSLILATILVQVHTEPIALSKALQLAREQHPVLKGLAMEIEAVRARREMDLAPFRPQVSLNGYAATGKGQMIFPSTGMPANYTLLPDSQVAVANAMFMWRFFTFGRDGSIRRAFNARIDSAQAMLNTERADLDLRVRLTFSEALLKQEIVRAKEDALASARELSRVTRLRVEAGSAPEAFLLRSEAEVARMEKELAMAGAERDSALSMLRAAVGMPGTETIVTGSWDENITLPESLDQALTDARRNRPELTRLEREQRAIQYSADAVRASRMPEVSVVAMADAMKQRGMPGEDAAKVGLVLSFPLLDGGERRAGVAETTAMGLRAGAEQGAVRLQIDAEVSSAWSVWQSVAPVMKASQAEVAASEEAYRIAMIRYEEGKAILAEVLEAKSQLTLARVGLAEAEAYGRVARSKLLRAWLGRKSAN